MKFHADQPLNNSVEAIGDQWVRIAGETHEQSLLLSHTGALRHWAVTRFEDLRAEDLAAIDTQGQELVVLGTGEQHRHLHPKLARSWIEAGVGWECMNSAAACRTYNVLISEGRRVLLALIQGQG